VVKVCILGSTGSIGTSTLDVVSRFGRSFAVAGLAAGSNIALLSEQIERFRPRLVSVARREDALVLRRRFRGRGLRVAFGPEGAEEVASFPGNDIVVAAITGTSGLRPTLAAVRAGVRVALANKESMAIAGALLRAASARSGAAIIPVDSEHSGVFQCLAAGRRRNVRRVILTASGGPFLRTPLAEIPGKSVAAALRHPRWKMGRKVTVDSATMMNKGLELMEARWLFNLPAEKLDVLIHPQSIVHALVELTDGSVLAQLGPTDMRLPIQYALTYPDRAASPLAPLDLAAVGRLEFRPVDERRYPLFGLARRALAAGGSAPVALNAANETAVGAFLAGRIPFGGLGRVVRAVMDGHVRRSVPDLEAIMAVDREARAAARRSLNDR
jgi:1-deoxy-D-xylulose-5-phosphate reductoisomerase